MDSARGPAQQPCGTCPYRRDVPAGVWAPEEYAKLPPYDEPTYGQPVNLFMCHQVDGRLCAGWVGCHGGDQLLAVRLAAARGQMLPAEIEATVGYVCPVPLFASGREAEAHGLSRIEDPDDSAHAAMSKIQRRREVRSDA